MQNTDELMGLEMNLRQMERGAMAPRQCEGPARLLQEKRLTFTFVKFFFVVSLSIKVITLEVVCC